MEPSSFRPPGDAVLQGLMNELQKAVKGLPDSQRRLMSLSAVAWSADGMVKAEVGPRGQLIDVEIDPRVFRRPDAQALRSSIMEAVTAAVRDVTGQAEEIMQAQMPPEVAELRQQYRPGAEDPMAQMLRTDAEILAERRHTDDDLR